MSSVSNASGLFINCVLHFLVDTTLSVLFTTLIKLYLRFIQLIAKKISCPNDRCGLSGAFNICCRARYVYIMTTYFIIL